MSYQIVKKGGSVVMVDRNRNQPERYVGSIEPFTTKDRLHEIQAFNKQIPNDLRPMRVMNQFGMIPTKSINKATEKRKTKARKGFKVPHQTEEEFREDLKRDKLRNKKNEKTHTEKMMEKQKEKKKENMKAYTIKELKTVQELEAENRTLHGELQANQHKLRKTKDNKERRALQEENRQILKEIGSRKKKTKKILGTEYSSGKQVAEDVEKGKVTIIE